MESYLIMKTLIILLWDSSLGSILLSGVDRSVSSLSVEHGEERLFRVPLRLTSQAVGEWLLRLE